MLAIIIPYYKITFFGETLESLANQTEKRFKVYIGDDAGPENPANLLEKYKNKFDFVYHRFDNNLGGVSLTQQWERCITLSGNEEWIMILGDDDVLGENVVEEFYKNLPEIERESINVIRYATQVIDEKARVNSEIYFHPIKEKSTDFLFKKMKNQTRSSLSEYLFRRENFKKYEFYDFPLGWHSDDMAFLLLSNFSIIYTINFATIKIRISNISISGKLDNIYLKNKATQLFYYTISDNYISYFTKKQRIKLIEKVEVNFFRQKSVFLFFKITRWHLRKTDLFNFFKFIRRIYINS
ncbi:glycosyltransferase [Flavobacterium granuli]|uniref:Glycosyltransferase involved in cell wall biosynthesis n=1 Tax=Flavobacterium granuli TaxID=280093 RepID=A0ABU1S670_9FLAO|nr:glycosyltransferase [Flavobacterium granuli]MDR6846417.1 glycosyltransferase involved in cell wall biosynthesis [Flavobacterium granuli]